MTSFIINVAFGRPGCRLSVRAVDGYREGGADLTHARVAQTTQSGDEDGDRDAFHRVEIHR
jgi:hypothetical protein